MARKRLQHTLPPLPRPRSFPEGAHQEQLLSDIVRHLALTHQTPEAQSFYPLRDIACAYRVPLSSVTRVYSRLEQEGLLSRIRGSKTLLLGQTRQRTLRVQGLVAMPASLSCFLTLQDYRLFFLWMRRVLRTRGFVTFVVYVDESDLREGHLSERLKLYQVDTVLWFLPSVAAQNTISRLTEMGMRVIGIADGGLPGIACKYEVRRELAMRKILRNWRSSEDLTDVTILVSSRRSSRSDQERIEALLDDENFSCEVAHVREGHLEESITSITSRAIILLSPVASMLAFRSVDLLHELLKNHRVAFVDGGITLPFARLPDARADIVSVDWRTVAEKIAQDLFGPAKGAGAEPVVFDAVAFPSSPLSRHFKSI